MTLRRYLSIDQIAAAMDVPAVWLRKHIWRLRRDHGFPRYAPGMGFRIDAADLAAWQDRQRQLRDESAVIVAVRDEDAELAEAAARMDARAAGMAAE